MKKWLFRPFDYIAGWSSLFTGMAILLLTAFVCAFGEIRLNGVIDLHVGTEVGLARALADSAINWLSLSFLLYVSGLILSKSSIRFQDVFGTQAMARGPLLLTALATTTVDFSRINQYFQYEFLKQGEPVVLTAFDIVALGLLGIVTIVFHVWMIVLMFRAYSVSCNLKGTRAVVSFIACLLIAEIGTTIFYQYY